MKSEITLRDDNPYVTGKIIEFTDGREILIRDKVTYTESPDDVYYTIKDGDTLSSLAGVNYNNSKLWWVLADVNDSIFNPWELPTGLTIVIPALSSLKTK